MKRNKNDNEKRQRKELNVIHTLHTQSQNTHIAHNISDNQKGTATANCVRNNRSAR